MTWTMETLTAYLQAPGKVVPDNKMDLEGMGAAGARSVADYLMTLK